ncbi:hypothetical protein M0804_009317 [Polistes exclamans]|nr:hypothetical protein M0804_009317 [Polistes exclamans]
MVMVVVVWLVAVACSGSGKPQATPLLPTRTEMFYIAKSMVEHQDGTSLQRAAAVAVAVAVAALSTFTFIQKKDKGNIGVLGWCWRIVFDTIGC